MRNEQGSATVLTLALALIICCAGMVSLLFVQLTLARSTLGSYADLAAIAAVQTAGEPCVAASLVSSHNGVELSACEIKDGQAIVEVRMPAPELLARFSHLDFLAVTARAGH